MALNNFVNIITDIYNPASVDSLFEQYGVEGFSGTDASLVSMNAPAWLFVVAYKTQADNGDDDGKIKDSVSNILLKKNSDNIVLYKEHNYSSQNILAQALLYFRGSNYKVDSIIDYYNDVTGDDKTIETISHQDTNNASVATIIFSDVKYIKGLDVGKTISTYKAAFIDVNYKNDYPLAGLIFKALFNDDIQDKVKEIIDKLKDNDTSGRFGKHDSIFKKFSTNNTEPVIEELCQLISVLSNEKADEVLSKDAYLYDILASLTDNVNTSPTPIIESIDFSKCTGFSYLETGFSLSTYKNKVADYYPVFGLMNVYIYNRGATINTDVINAFIDNNLSNPYTFPYEDTIVSGVNLISQLAYTWSFDNEIGGLSDLLTKLFSQIETNITFDDGDSNFQKTVKINAVAGFVSEFTEGSQINMYGAINILFNKINAKHKKWCKDNNKNFDDYDSDEGYGSDRDKVFGLYYIDFDSYKKWCQNFGKDF